MAQRVRVKICGINSPEAYQAAASADWVGFVFFPPSPRYVTPRRAAELWQPGGPLRVGLFVEPTDAEIDATLAIMPLDVLQLVADADRAAAVRRRFRVPVWRTVAVGGLDDLPTRTQGEDALLLDAKPDAGALLPGGNAQAFDWSVLRGWTAPGPWLLAGGLTADNVAQAIEQTDASAVDVSSGVERTRGEKDPAMIAAFLHAAHTVADLSLDYRSGTEFKDRSRRL